MDLQTLFLGEPEYDNNGTIVSRKLGVQNMIAWLFIGLVGYQLMCRGGKKQSGGGPVAAIGGAFVLGLLFLVFVLGSASAGAGLGKASRSPGPWY